MTPAELQPLIDWLNTNPHWVLFSLGFSAFLESLALVGIIVPGVAILFVIAAVAGNADISLWHALVAGFSGAVLGDVISFYIGYIFKDRLPGKWPFTRFPQALSTGEAFFEKHGGKSVVIGRFVGPIRPVLPIVAGMMGMSQIRFISINILSALVWSPFYILPGYWSGAAAQQSFPDNFIIVFISTLLVLSLVTLSFRYASQALQPGSRWYDLLDIKKQSSPAFAKIWHFLTKHHQEPKEFPLASLALLLLASSFFWCWTLIHLYTDWLNHIDQIVLQLVTQLRNEAIDAVFVSFTLIGNEAFLYCSFILLVSLLAIRKQYLAAAHIAAGGLATAAITHSFKAWFAIPRPDVVAMPPSSFAYPSGHSSGAVIFWGLLASLIAQDLTKHKRWQVYLTLFIPMFFIALSRVFLGVHWLSDIIGGIVLGLAICALTRISYSRYNAKPLDLLGNNRKELVIFALLWLTAAVIYQALVFGDTFSQLQLKG